MDAVIKSVSGMLDMSVYTDKQKPMQSAKNALQEWCADKKRRLPAPRYETLSEDGPDHKKTYMRACYIGDRLMGRGVGKNFKIADAAAAEDALNKLMAENSDDSTTKVDNMPQSTPKNKTAAKKTASNSTTQAEPAVIQAPPVISAHKTTLKKHASHLATLKALATSQKKPSPAFRDLGETGAKGNAEYHIECIFDAKSVVGIGKTRIEARENAAKLMADLISEKKKPTAKKTQANKKNEAPDNTEKKSDTPHTQGTKNANASTSKKRPPHKRHYAKKRTTRTAKAK
jgi:dsRNA-specific ribonuclease